MKIDLKELQKVQLELDININERHATSYETTKDERLLALLVEVAELANAHVLLSIGRLKVVKIALHF